MAEQFEEVVIRGDEVVYQTRVENRRIQLGSFVEALRRNSSPVASGDLPWGCRQWHSSGNTQTFVVEEKPRTRTLSIIIPPARDGGRSSYKDFRLSLPSVIWLINSQDGALNPEPNIFFTEQYQGAATALKVPPLNNIGGGGVVCMGTFSQEITEPLHTRVEGLIGHFWAARFNNDLRENRQFMEGNGLSYEAWQESADPGFALQATAGRNAGTLQRQLAHRGITI